MSTFYIDTAKLEERCGNGESCEKAVKEDLEKLCKDVRVVYDILNKQGKTEKAHELCSVMKEISATTVSMTDVCKYDRLAVHDYRELAYKIRDIVSAIEV